MDLWEAMGARHSVRRFTDQRIEGEALDGLKAAIAAANERSGLHIQLCLDEPSAFAGRMARYGKFENVKNYIALVGKKGDGLEEACGYYGEEIVLKAQQLGLHTCWVALSYSKGKGKGAVSIAADEKLVLVIAVGYGQTRGVPHKGKPLEVLGQREDAPRWFQDGVAAAQLAPSAMNQQKFRFEWQGDKVAARAGSGFYTKIDLGIAKYHFQLGAGEGNWSWA